MFLIQQFVGRFYRPPEFILKIFIAIFADPPFHILCAIKFALNVGHCFFPAKFAMLVPKQLYFFSFKVLFFIGEMSNMILGIFRNFLKKHILFDIRLFPECGKNHFIKNCIFQVFFLTVKSPILFHIKLLFVHLRLKTKLHSPQANLVVETIVC